MRTNLPPKPPFDNPDPTSCQSLPMSFEFYEDSCAMDLLLTSWRPLAAIDLGRAPFLTQVIFVWNLL